MVSREQCLKLLKTYFNETSQKYGVKSMALFGSVARNEQNSDSDIDILYEGSPNMLQRIKMQNELEQIFNHPVDLVRSRPSLSGSIFMQDITNDLIYV